MRRCFLSVANSVKFCRMSSTTSGRSMLSTVGGRRPANLPARFPVIAPRSPDVDRHADRAVAEQLPLRGERKDVRHEHRRHLLLVNLVHLKRPVEPRHRAARGRLGLTDDQRQTVDQKDHVEPLLHRAGLVSPLVRDTSRLFAGFAAVHEPHGHVLAVRAEGHRLLAAQPGHEILVGPDQTIRLHRQKNRSQRVDHLVGAVGLRRDFGIEPDERLAATTTPPSRRRADAESAGRHVFPFGWTRTPHRANRPSQARLRARATDRCPLPRDDNASRIICSTVLDSVKLMTLQSVRERCQASDRF